MAQQLPPTLFTDAPWMPIGIGEIGTRELLADGTLNPRILFYFASTSYPAKLITRTTPWCGAYVSNCLERAGVRSARSARARDYLTWGVALERFRPGCVMVYRRGPDPKKAHVCFGVDDLHDSEYLTLDGNNGNRVRYAKHPVEDLLGMRWPAPKK